MYDDADVVAAHLRDEITHDLRDGAAVLVCLSPSLATTVIDDLDAPVERLTVLPQDDRYAHPGHAMQMLWACARASNASGAPYLHSIGEIGFTGGASDAMWHWYESAVNEVFGGSALRATCLFDTQRLPDGVLESALVTHPLLDSGDGRLPSEQYAAPSRDDIGPAPLRPPVRKEDLWLTRVDNTGVLRRAIREHGRALTPAVLASALLVASELGSNAIKYGDGTADARLWFHEGQMEIEVSDRGPGVFDPYALLRPPDLPMRGAGLWLAHLNSLAMSLEPGPLGGTVARAVVG